MSTDFQSKTAALTGIYDALFKAGEKIYVHLKRGSGLKFAASGNESGDEQIELDIIADEAFFETLSKEDNVRYVVSEERPGLAKLSDGPYSIALDPLDGSKAALIGIPSGAIFGIFENADVAEDFNGGNIIGGGFFVFGINLEVYFADGTEVFKGIFNQETGKWTVLELTEPMPSTDILAINGSNQLVWDQWLQDHYLSLLDTKGGTVKPHNMRWFASMVSDLKRLLLQGGIFAYPGANRKGYEQGHLRLVYEAIPMSYLIHQMGGSSTDGTQSLLTKPVTELHEKTPVFIGNADKIAAIEAAKRGA